MQLLFLPGQITQREHCYDRVEPLAKYPGNPIMVADRPWEGQGVYWPTVLYSEREGLFRMWYEISNALYRPRTASATLIDNAQISARTFLCYATSRDGLHWDKPALGVVHLEGYPDTNILMGDAGYFLGTVGVLDDPDDPDPTRRFKLLMYDNDGAGTDGARTAISPDGIHWTFVGGFPVLPTQDTPNLWYNRPKRQYVALLKTRLDNRRARMVSVSDDFCHWSPPRVLLAPDMADAPTLHFYGQTAFEHRDHVLGFLNRYDYATQRLDIELIASPRGEDWQRLPTRPPVLSPGDPTAWDGQMVLPGLGAPVPRGDTCWFYYYGASNRHDEAGETGAVGLATFRAGRLAGQQFEHEGWFSSLPFRCPGGALTLDAVARYPLTVEVLVGSYGSVRPGYTRAECQPVEGDSPAHVIRWAAHADLDAFRDQFISLRVCGRDSVVYGAEVGEMVHG